ncbi:MAG TPA: SUMF1/EgtB/PvdO family nonheme iron enzyme [Polyangiaceae bacterium]|nr:SUMF1/EgtB/PvdO family nonheme iron enzyme [Polyangiaceae bacterium]
MSIARITLLTAFSAQLLFGCKQPREATQRAPLQAPAPQLAIQPAPTRAVTAVPTEAESQPPATQPTQPPKGMVFVPGGYFEMGPPRSVTLGKAPERTRVSPFFLDRTEVTVEAYRACVKGGTCAVSEHQEGCNFTAKKPRLQHPMNCITKTQAEQYCAAQGKRLPTAAEWEFAARGTDGRIYPWGNEAATEQLCWQGRAGATFEATCPVGSFPNGASPFGALDMAGNVAEWTSTPETETEGEGAFRTRGGGYPLEPIDLASKNTLMIRADQWESFSGDDASPKLGVRCAKNL